MQKLDVLLENCYGIEKLDYSFDFSKGNTITIYARNGMMKTSFAKTFQKLQDNKLSEIRDEIFGEEGSANIQIDGVAAQPEDVFVIRSFESGYEADITPLLIDDSINESLKNVLKARDKLLKAFEKNSGLKIKKTSGGKTVYELENVLISDMGFSEKSILLNLDEFVGRLPEVDFGDVTYSTIFDATVLKKIASAEFQNAIQEYINVTDSVYGQYMFLEKGKLTLPKLKDLRKSLQKDDFFVNGNHIGLGDGTSLLDLDSLDITIATVEDELKTTPEFKKIEKLLSDAKGIPFKDVIEMHPDIITYLNEDGIPILKRELWLAYIHRNQELFNDLIHKYHTLSEQIEAVQMDDTLWKQALDIFTNRFSVPYKMTISNFKGAVIGESIPQVEFEFVKGTRTVKMDRSRLEDIDTLSQGEKRALYLLNIIFSIEEIKKSGRSVLFVVDDIADSFDYKNKYAIIEYLYELSQDLNFNLLILSHNFDFYRTVSKRLGVVRENKLFAELHMDEVVLIQEKYQNQPFLAWKKTPDKKHVIALIPFVRNIIEYGKDRKVKGQKDADFLCLTSLLHEKANTANMTFGDIKRLFEEYIGVKKFQQDIVLTDKVIEALYAECDLISSSNADLEYKVLLAMAIRHKAEAYMKEKIKAFSGNLQWKFGGNIGNGNSSEFLSKLESNSNQTSVLLNVYKQIGTSSEIKLFEEVNIMTPENIHLNSFMYEPLLDMDIIELISLYDSVKNL